MKICYIVPEVYNCGPINVVKNLISVLSVSHEIGLISLRGGRDESLNNFFSNICSLGFYDFKKSINLKDDILKIANKFDVIHSHGYYPDKILSCLDVDVKKISTIHSMFYQDYPKEYGFLKGIIGAFIHFKVFKKNKFDHIIACSKALADYFYDKTKLNNISFINNGVDQSLFFPLDPVSKNNRLNEVGFHNYKRTFVYSGRLIRRKRVPELINFFVNNANSDDLLIVLGEGEEFDDCKKIAKNNIIFLGHVNNPEYYYQISDFIISNSSAEGYPMSILEAASCGCFAILSNIKPHVEFVENNPDISELLNNFNFNDVVEINSNYSFSELSSLSMAKKYLDFYKKV